MNLWKPSKRLPNRGGKPHNAVFGLARQPLPYVNIAGRHTFLALIGEYFTDFCMVLCFYLRKRFQFWLAV